MTQKEKYFKFLFVVIFLFILIFPMSTYAISDTNNYTITIKIDENTASSIKPTLTSKNYTFPKNTFTKTDYTFVGWKILNISNSNRLFSEGEKLDLSTITSDKKISIIPIWAKSGEFLTYVLKGNGATEGTTKYIPVKNNFVYMSPSDNFKKIGYTFSGWNTKADGSGKSYSAKTFLTKSPSVTYSKITLYAQWTPNKYTITFIGNGSDEGTTAKISAQYNKTYTLTANGFKKKGYSFIGWNTKGNGSGTSFANKASVKNLKSADGGNISLYAQWTPTKYKITYNLDNGKNNPSNPSNFYITSNTITFASPSKTGYTFLGWYNDSALTKKVTKLLSGSLGNKTIYAKWEPNKYTITFIGNGSDEGTTSKITAQYDNTYTLTANGFKKKGYTFIGWNTKADGSGTSFANKASVKNLKSANGGNISLYAQWTPTKYKITYNLDNGKNNPSNPSNFYITSNTITFASPSKTGYTFLGWYNDSTLAKKITKLLSGSIGNKTIYAKWDPNIYTITFIGNGATEGTTSRISAQYDKTYTLTANGFKKKGYIFNEWNTKADGSGTSFANKASVKNLKSANSGNISLYAMWKPISYTIQFNGNGATSGSTASISAKYGTEYTLTANGFKKDNYIFDGWNTKADGSGTSFDDKASIKNLQSTDGSIITLYAQWENGYTKIPLSVTSHTQSEIKAFYKKYPTSTNDVYEKDPVTTGNYAPSILSKETLQHSLNAINNIRYIAGLSSNVTENSTYSYNAGASALINYLNNSLSHYPAVPSNMKETDQLYKDAYYGSSHSNIAWGYSSIYHSILGYMEDSDSSNIDRVGHRRWILYPHMKYVGFGKAINFYAMQVFDDYWYGPSGQSVAWPAQNTPTQFFLNGSAWSLSMGKTVDASKINVTVKSKSDKKIWNFSNTSSDGFFNVENSYYGDPGCIIFRPDNIDTSAGKSYTVKVYFDDSKTKIEYDVNFFSL